MRDTCMSNRTLAWSWPGRNRDRSFGRAPVTLANRRRRRRPTADRLVRPGSTGWRCPPTGGGRVRLRRRRRAAVEVATGRILRERFDHEGALLAAAWSGDGRWCIAFGGWDDRSHLSRRASASPRPGPRGPATPWTRSPSRQTAACSRSDRSWASCRSGTPTAAPRSAGSGATAARSSRWRRSVPELWISGGRDGCRASTARRRARDRGRADHRERRRRLARRRVGGLREPRARRRGLRPAHRRAARGVPRTPPRPSVTVAFSPDGRPRRRGLHDGTCCSSPAPGRRASRSRPAPCRSPRWRSAPAKSSSSRRGTRSAASAWGSTARAEPRSGHRRGGEVVVTDGSRCSKTRSGRSTSASMRERASRGSAIRASTRCAASRRSGRNFSRWACEGRRRATARASTSPRTGSARRARHEVEADPFEIGRFL